MAKRHLNVALAAICVAILPLAGLAQPKPAVTITESGGKTEVTEGGATDSYTVVLDTQPTANVTVTLTVPTAQLQVSSTILTFTPGIWSSAQTVNVTAVDDALDEGLHLATITHAASSSDPDYNGVPVADVTVTINDNDKAKVTITESGGKTEVTEGGATDSYTVVLDTQPAADVTITLTVPTAQLLADAPNLTFTLANWNVAQTVNVTAVNDTVDEGLHLATITHSASSSDGNYDGLPVGDVDVAITDNDKAKVTITESGGKTEVTEGGATDSYTVVLDTQPAANVTVALTVPTAQLQANPTNLTFTPANWNAAQTVNVIAVDDHQDEGLHLATINHTSSSSDVNYSGLPVGDVILGIADNDKAKVTITESGGKTEVAEGGVGDSYQVVLDTQPTANVIVTLNVPHIQLQTDKTNLTFTPSNWNVAQTVAVSAVDDHVIEGLHTATITHTTSSADANYNAIPVSEVVVSINDNDQATAIISLSGNLAFGNVTVGMSAQRSLTISNIGNSALMVSSITFPSNFSGNWSGTIRAGGSTNVPVTFSPMSADNFSGILTVNSDATGGTNTIGISGTGMITPPETQRPTLRITSPTAGQRWSNAVFMVKGTAKDNVRVAEVRYQINAAGWELASSTNGWTNWTATVSLLPGTNVLRAYVVDTSGNTSLTNRVNFIHVLSDRLLAQTTGQGTLSPNYSNAVLEIDKSYTMTAKPGTGYVFSNWVDGAGIVLTNGTTLKFLMQSNLTLQANFISNPFIPVKGVYTGLFYDTNDVAQGSSGFFTLTLTDKGTFTATMQSGAKRYSFTGQFDLLGRAAKNVSRPGTNALAVTLQLDLHGTDHLSGQISDGVWAAELEADRAIFNALTNPATQAGKYTMIIPGSTNTAASPGGDGFGAITVSTAGKIQLTGTLADGTKVTQASAISKNGLWPLYISLYGGQGSILSWITFTDAPADDLNGALSWIRPALPTAKYYPGGFTNDTTASGSVYHPPVGTTNRVLNFTNAQVILNDGNLSQSITNDVVLAANNRVSNLSSNKLSLTFTLSSGLFRGSVVNPATAKAIPFSGAALQKENSGRGFFLGTNQSGRVYFGQ